MIPQKIHFCWLSNDPFPAEVQQCIDSWKRHMPNHEIKRWSTENFDIHAVPLVKEAFEAKKYAFATDYIRCYALYHEGGIYLDSDVLLHKSLEPLLQEGDYVTAVEYQPYGINSYRAQVDEEGKRRPTCDVVEGIGLQAAFMASVAGHPMVKRLLDTYTTLHLDEVLNNRLIAPVVQAKMAEGYGFRYVNEVQHLQDDMVIYSTSYIGQKRSEVTGRYATHLCAGGWVEPSFKIRLINLCDRIGLYQWYLNIKDRLGLIHS